MGHRPEMQPKVTVGQQVAFKSLAGYYTKRESSGHRLTRTPSNTGLQPTVRPLITDKIKWMNRRLTVNE